MRYDPHTPDQIEEIVAAVHAAYSSWTVLSVARRVEYLRALADQLQAERETLARQSVLEVGKPISEARAEVDKCIWACEYYAAAGPLALAPREVMTDASHSWVAHEPIGVVLAVMPWNFPYWQVLRFAAPTLLAGNTGILKHSPNVTGCALLLERVFIDAGLPANVFRTLLVSESEVPETIASLINDRRIAAVTLTGSERAGAAVAALAGGAIKKCVLELGGSDPFVVLDDADLPTAATMAVKSRFLNAGQSCLAAKRLIVHRSVYEKFVQLFVAATSSLRVEDPSLESSTLGPMAREDLVKVLESQVAASMTSGAKLLFGGKRMDRSGFWFEPTILSDVTLDMAVMNSETFGPVAAIIAVDDDSQAASVANATRFGLGASIWSSDVDRALAIGRQITSGALFVNAVVASDPRLPFGGTKHSGYGRELGPEGALEFTNVRSFVVKEPSAGQESRIGTGQ
ncbi:MAG: NAD-dependent succinate-semialdehyde dehydrogenase [Acidimicrobiaceae bacterium]|nr:NAD-dependent succinate-semialdehyde dehydrogenase [Acidimicrobiaceae bacterium]